MDQSSRRDVDQIIATLEAQLAHQRERKRKLFDGQKVVIGGMMLSLAERDEGIRRQLIGWMEKQVTRPADVRRIRPVIEQLKGTSTAEGTPGKKAVPSRPQLDEI